MGDLIQLFKKAEPKPRKSRAKVQPEPEQFDIADVLTDEMTAALHDVQHLTEALWESESKADFKVRLRALKAGVRGLPSG